MYNNLTYVFPNTNFTDLTIYQYGEEKCAPLLACGPAIRHHYLLHYILSGKGIFSSANGDEHTVSAGQAFLIHPNSISFYCADHHDPWHYIWIEFDGLKAPAFIAQAGLSIKNPIYTSSQGSAEELKRRLVFLVERSDATPLELIGTLYFILDELIKTSVTKNLRREGNLQEFYVHEAINYIERNYDKNIGVEGIAAWCNLNRSYFGKIFKNTMLVSPRDFLHKYRMNRACDLLKGGLSISDTAHRVGYENPLHFSRAFRNIFGTSPREWRNRNSH
jgi:AraC-like DNA-binding protein